MHNGICSRWHAELEKLRSDVICAKFCLKNIINVVDDVLLWLHNSSQIKPLLEEKAKYLIAHTAEKKKISKY